MRGFSRIYSVSGNTLTIPAFTVRTEVVTMMYVCNPAMALTQGTII